MVFIPRDPVVQNQFLVHDTTQGNGTETAGCVVHLSGDQLVACVSGTGVIAYGFLMQNVKAESSAHPTGFRLPGDLGSSDAFSGDPVAVAHLGIYDTTHYETGVTYTAGGELTVGSNGRVTPSGDGSQTLDSVVAVAQNTLDATAVAAGANLRIKLLI